MFLGGSDANLLVFWTTPWSGPKMAIFSKELVKKWTLPGQGSISGFLQPAIRTSSKELVKKRTYSEAGRDLKKKPNPARLHWLTKHSPPFTVQYRVVYSFHSSATQLREKH